jgi:soluble lytic murein transglycosylase
VAGKSRYTELAVSTPTRFLALFLIVSLVAPGIAVPAAAQTTSKKSSTSSSGKKKSTASKTSSKSGAKKKSASKKGKSRAKVSAARAQKLRRTFVASSDLRPMARQLVEFRTPAAYSGVQGYAEKHAGTEAGALAWFAIGYSHYLDAQYPQAILAMQKAAPKMGELADYTSFFIGNSYVLSNQPEESFTYLRDFGTRYPDSLYAQDATIAYAKALLAGNRPADAVKVLQAANGPEAEFYLAKAYVANGQNRSGAELFRHIYYDYATSYLADSAGTELKKLPEAAFLAAPTFAEHQKRAEQLYRGKRYSSAADEYKAMLDMAPANMRSDVLIDYANSLIKTGQNREAAAVLDRIPDDGTEAAAEKWYQRLELARSAQDDATLLKTLTYMRTNFPHSLWLESGLLSTGNMYLLRKDYDQAINYYREVQERFPNGSKASYAHWKYAWLTYRQGRTDEAKKAFARQVELYPASAEVPNAMYWRGRIAEDEHDTATARAYYTKLSDRFKNYYYGVLARKRLALMPAAAPANVAALQQISYPKPYEGDALRTSPPDDDLHYSRAKLLENAGALDLAVRELQNGTTEGPSWEMLEVARMYTAAGEYFRAMQALKKCVSGYFAMEINQLPAEYWHGLFPRPYWDSLRRQAEQNGLDPYLVSSLIRQESEFNPSAVSHSNALGLMQLLPKTGKGEAKEVGLKGYNSDSLFDPNINIQLGTRYFRKMVDHFNGQVEYALAAYNAGDSRVEEWRNAGSYRDIDEFVESIPFTETRDYVQAIMRNAEVYKRVYGTP